MSVIDKLKRRLIASGLEHLYRKTGEPRAMNFDAERDKLVCVSDLHRGRRDGADDFRRSERVYNAALAWYHAKGYHLAVLGDAEDLWECTPRQVLGNTNPSALEGYARSLALEKRFNDDGRYLRVYGNHDRRWLSKHAVQKWLKPHLGPVDVRGAITIAVQGGAGDIGSPERPVIMLTHGDAGTLDSAVFAPISETFVRFWAFWQKKIGALTGIPADDWDLREEQDVTMYKWASGHEPRLLLITGHTHRPVFATRRAPHPPDVQQITIFEDRQDTTNAISAEELAAGEFAIAETRRQAGLRSCVVQTRPCYFNTGACCFGDGEITTIEIADAKIRLYRWASRPEEGHVRAEILDEAELHEVLTQIHAPVETAPAAADTGLLGEVTVIHDTVHEAPRLPSPPPQPAPAPDPAAVG